MSDEPLAIDVRDVSKSFEKVQIKALDGATLQVRKGEFVALVGPSGCGKSTLLHLIAALDRPDAGTITVGGHELRTERDLPHYRARDIGLIFQLHNLLPSLSAGENVQIPMFEMGVSARDRRQRALRLLAMTGLEGRETNRPAELSGGERQRVAIARALANDPSILLADEPTGSLDSCSGRHVLDMLQELRAQRGLTILLVTHDPGVAGRADRIVRMLDGRMVGEESPRPPTDASSGAGTQST